MTRNKKSKCCSIKKRKEKKSKLKGGFGHPDQRPGQSHKHTFLTKMWSFRSNFYFQFVPSLYGRSTFCLKEEWIYLKWVRYQDLSSWTWSSHNAKPLESTIECLKESLEATWEMSNLWDLCGIVLNLFCWL